MRVEVGAEFASMPSRRAVHTFTVNLMCGMWEMFHLIRFIWQTKGLPLGCRGHMAHHRAHDPRCDLVIRM
ncbi:hypothetical protein BIV24_18480 [Streptomyces colonosanans]|uniref:Uncharacterized protein n=1 Tax=Streptomyces colonosanans TaxID=1428652 RepID=A0A1S2P9X4_9ACTN|nr:hypothetical protein BIV24_18480 [Streptomyces colonosanans]